VVSLNFAPLENWLQVEVFVTLIPLQELLNQAQAAVLTLKQSTSVFP
jgi:hypothetical protein